MYSRLRHDTMSPELNGRNAPAEERFRSNSLPGVEWLVDCGEFVHRSTPIAFLLMSRALLASMELTTAILTTGCAKVNGMVETR